MSELCATQHSVYVTEHAGRCPLSSCANPAHPTMRRRHSLQALMQLMHRPGLAAEPYHRHVDHAMVDEVGERCTCFHCQLSSRGGSWADTEGQGLGLRV